jgi:hypothetical protein
MAKMLSIICLALTVSQVNAEPLTRIEKIEILGDMFAEAKSCSTVLSKPDIADDNLDTLELINEMYASVNKWMETASNEDLDTFFVASDAADARLENEPADEFGCKFMGLSIMGYVIGSTL